MASLSVLLSDSNYSLLELSSLASIDDFCQLIFHSAGLESFEYEHFDPESFFTDINNQPLADFPLIFENTYIKSYYRFVTTFFKLNNCQMLFDEEAMVKIIELLDLFVNQCWDSFRHVSIYTVSFLMTIILELEETGVSSLGDELNSDQVEYLENLWDKLFVIWKRCNRDVDIGVRKIVYQSMYRWAVDHTKLMFSSKPIIAAIHVPRSLKESATLRWIAFKTLEKLTTSVVNSGAQSKLIQLVLNDLIHSIKDDQLGIISLNILQFAARNFDLKLSAKDFGLIFRHCYDVREDIRKSAANFSCLYFYSSNPYDTLKQFILFHYRSLMKCHKEYVDLFYERTNNIFTWTVWKSYLENCTCEIAPTATGVFYQWVKKAVNDSSTEEGFDSWVDNAEAKSFTDTFSGHWVNLFQSDSISKNIESQIDFIKIVEFFSEDIIFNDLAVILEKIIELDSDKDVIAASCFSFNVLNKKYSQDPVASAILKSLYINKMSNLFPVFVECMKYSTLQDSIHNNMVIQVDMMTRYLTFYDNMWEELIDVISELDSTEEENGNIEEFKKVIISRILLNLLMNKLNHLKTVEINIDQFAMICAERCVIIFSCIQPISLSRIESHKYQALYILSVMYENFGPHMKYHENKNFNLLAKGFDINKILFVLETTVDIYNDSICTNEESQSNSTEINCCDLIKKIGHLFSEGMLDIKTFYQKFFSHITLNSRHHKLIVNCFQRYCTNFPDRIAYLAEILFHRSVCIYHSSLSSGQSTESSMAKVKKYYKLFLGNEWSLSEKDNFNLFSKVAELIIEFAFKSVTTNIHLLMCLSLITNDQPREIKTLIVDLLRKQPKTCSDNLSVNKVLDDVISSMKI